MFFELVLPSVELNSCRYYVSSWCRNQAPGGFLIDMSVHHMAALRLVAEAANAGHALTVKASTRDSGTGLAAPDCADATVTWSSGLVSCLSICMVASQVRFCICLACSFVGEVCSRMKVPA